VPRPSASRWADGFPTTLTADPTSTSWDRKRRHRVRPARESAADLRTFWGLPVRFRIHAHPSTRWLSRLWFRVKREGPASGTSRATAIGSSGSPTARHRGPGRAVCLRVDGLGAVRTQISKNKFVSQFTKRCIEGGLGCWRTTTAGTSRERTTRSFPTLPSPREPKSSTQHGQLHLHAGGELLPPDTSGDSSMSSRFSPATDPPRMVVSAPLSPLCRRRGPAGPPGTGLEHHSGRRALRGSDPDPAPWTAMTIRGRVPPQRAMFRNQGGNSGGWVTHYLGYRVMLVNTGNYGAGAPCTSGTGRDSSNG